MLGKNICFRVHLCTDGWQLTIYDKYVLITYFFSISISIFNIHFYLCENTCAENEKAVSFLIWYCTSISVLAVRDETDCNVWERQLFLKEWPIHSIPGETLFAAFSLILVFIRVWVPLDVKNLQVSLSASLPTRVCTLFAIKSHHLNIVVERGMCSGRCITVLKYQCHQESLLLWQRRRIST